MIIKENLPIGKLTWLNVNKYINGGGVKLRKYFIRSQ